MTDNITPNTSIKLMANSQASKYVVFNELARKLDALYSCTNAIVLDKDLTSSPGSPADGDTYIVASGASGSWAGQDKKIAYYNTNTWVFYTPIAGWLVYITDEAIFYKYNGTNWVVFNDALQNVSLLGVNATADATNKFAVSSAATLFNHVGNGHQQKINKNASGDTASQLFQTGFSGRGEWGLIGNDHMGLRTSPNGSIFNDAMLASKDDGHMSFPNGIYNGTNTIADDAALAIAVPDGMFNSGVVIIHRYDTAGNAPDLSYSAVLFFDAGTSAAVASIYTGTTTTLTTGILAGTTGADARVTISAHSNGNIYIENRSGSSATFRYAFIG